MIGIYICDDEYSIRNEIRKVIESKVLIEQYDMEVLLSCASPTELIDTVKKSEHKRCIYFLDVDLKHEQYDGFLLGKTIRTSDPHATIIFITSYHDLAYQTFQYHIEAFDYILKNRQNLANSICHCLEEIQLKRKEERNHDILETFTIKSGDVVKHFAMNDIYFFETSPKQHHLIMYTKNSKVDFVGNLNEIESQLPDSFIRTHRSYLIAIDKIDEFNLKQNQIIIAGHICMVSRKMKSEVLKLFGNQ